MTHFYHLKFWYAFLFELFGEWKSRPFLHWSRGKLQSHDTPNACGSRFSRNLFGRGRMLSATRNIEETRARSVKTMYVILDQHELKRLLKSEAWFRYGSNVWNSFVLCCFFSRKMFWKFGKAFLSLCYWEMWSHSLGLTSLEIWVYFARIEPFR